MWQFRLPRRNPIWTPRKDLGPLKMRTKTILFDVKPGQASSFRKKPFWSHSETTGPSQLVHGPCCGEPRCFQRQMWLPLRLFGLKSWKRMMRGTGQQTGLWLAEKRRYCHKGHFTHQWSRFLLCHYLWGECAKVWWLLATNKTKPDKHVIFIYNKVPAHCHSQSQHKTKKVTTIQSILKHCRTSYKFLERSNQRGDAQNVPAS